MPTVELLRRSARIGDLATATAGFRDEYFAFAEVVRERGPGSAAAPDDPALLTSGGIDVLGSSWSTRATRISRRSFDAPVVDLAALRERSPRVAAWLAARLVRKLVLATQTAVLEVAVDELGRFAPGVPGDFDRAGPRHATVDLHALVAALSSPLVAAWARGQFAGAARSAGAIKLAARHVLDIPLPNDLGTWRTATEHVTALVEGDRTTKRWKNFAVAATAAYAPAAMPGTIKN